MEKLKKKRLNNKTSWMIFVGIVLIIFLVLAVGRIINYTNASTTMANGNVSQNEIVEDIIEQVNLVDTSKLSQEELEKLNEEEVKKAEEKQEEEEKKNNNNKNSNTTKPAQNKYYIKINYGAQVVNVYTYDKNEKYTVPVKAFVCSTGTATPTSGVYRISWKSTWGKLFGNVWGQYCTQIVGDILFHSVPYKQNRKDTLVSAYYDRLGTKDSMGCIRLTTIDALWIFNNCASGTQVEFYSSSNPGPLGKPTAQKVSNAPGKLKNWDPTDPDLSNPWRNYKPSEGGTNKPNDNENTNSSSNTNTNANTNTNTNTNNNTNGNNNTNININIDINEITNSSTNNNTNENTNSSTNNNTNKNTNSSTNNNTNENTNTGTNNTTNNTETSNTVTTQKPANAEKPTTNDTKSPEETRIQNKGYIAPTIYY